MSATFYELLKYAKTGIASPEMTEYDKLKALAMCKGGFPVATLTGIPPLSFKSDGTPLTAWSMKGNGSQQGTPTPSAPIQPQECGDRTAQLFDKTTATIDYRVTASGTTYSENFACTDYINIEGLSSIAVSSKPNATNIYFYSSKTESADSYVNNFSATIPAGAKYVRVNFLKTDLDTFMLNTGSTALPFEPFGYKIPITCGGTTQTVYLSEPLRKIGDYADKVEQDGTVTRRIKKLALTGDENWLGFNGSYYADGVTDYLHANYTAFCSHFPTSPNSTGRSSAAENSLCFGSGSLNRIFFKWDGFSTYLASDLISYLQQQYAAGTPVTVWYVLATAQTETFTAPTITPANGANTLTVDTDLQPSEVSITGKIKAS